MHFHYFKDKLIMMLVEYIFPSVPKGCKISFFPTILYREGSLYSHAQIFIDRQTVLAGECVSNSYRILEVNI